MGPMVAAGRFLDLLRQYHKTEDNKGTLQSLRITLYGSLAYTGAGHATDRASILGLAGFLPGEQ